MAIRKPRHRERFTEPDLTPFMNLMVIMIPSLLVNAVFTQVSVLRVDQPGTQPSAAAVAALPPLSLVVSLRGDRIDIDNEGHGSLGQVAAQDYAGLNAALRRIKQTYPKATQVTIRAAQDTPYQDIVYAADAVRVVTSEQTGKVYALFPEVQIGPLEDPQ